MVSINRSDLRPRELEVLWAVDMCAGDGDNDEWVGSSAVRDELGLEYTSQTSDAFDSLEDSGLIVTRYEDRGAPGQLETRVGRITDDGELLLDEVDVKPDRDEAGISMGDRVGRLERQLDTAREVIHELREQVLELEERVDELEEELKKGIRDDDDDAVGSGKDWQF